VRAGSPLRFAPTELERCASRLLEAVGVGQGDAWWSLSVTVSMLVPRMPNSSGLWNAVATSELAMKAFGMGTDRFPGMPGTEFEKDNEGHYTGIVHSYTFTFIGLEYMVPQASFEERVNSLTNVIHELNRFGITTALDAAAASGYSQGHSPIDFLAKENQLNIRFPFIDLQFGDVGVFLNLQAQNTIGDLTHNVEDLDMELPEASVDIAQIRRRHHAAELKARALSSGIISGATGGVAHT
jgi:hypothetical protein